MHILSPKHCHLYRLNMWTEVWQPWNYFSHTAPWALNYGRWPTMFSTRCFPSYSLCFLHFWEKSHSSLQADFSQKPLHFHHPILNTFSDYLCCLSVSRRCLIMRHSVPLLQGFLCTGNMRHILVAQKCSSGCNGLYVMPLHLAFDMRSNDVSASMVL